MERLTLIQTRRAVSNRPYQESIFVHSRNSFRTFWCYWFDYQRYLTRDKSTSINWKSPRSWKSCALPWRRLPWWTTNSCEFQIFKGNASEGTHYWTRRIEAKMYWTIELNWVPPCGARSELSWVPPSGARSQQLIGRVAPFLTMIKPS